MNRQTIYFGGGCFWCTEAIFQRLIGVTSVVSGYTGGHVKNPTYEQVSSGTTGHAEVIKIEYNPEEVPVEVLLDVFFGSHDPTTLNRQGADTGTQYRSIVFYTTEEQKHAIEAYVAKLGGDRVFSDPIVTEVKKLGEFYEAEDYHQNYFNQNSNKPYCQLVINPKIVKLKQHYAQFLRPE